VKAWLEAMDSGRLNPPTDVHDAAAWDTYWTNQLEVGAPDQGFSDIMSSHGHLVELLARRDVRTILCAGNGLSTEALALALHGFQVTALDISAVAGDYMAAALRRPHHPVSRIPGLRFTDESIVFADAGQIAAELCPKIHQTASHPPRGGGSLTFATGDLLNADVCPGPYDAVIERRTVQLFPQEEIELALERLTSRLAPRGMFVSHLHDGRGRPREHRPHHASEWAKSHGFTIDYEADLSTRRSAARLACLMMSTG
jgi:hypothetical protein